jgi:hypothetical protein
MSHFVRTFCQCCVNLRLPVNLNLFQGLFIGKMLKQAFDVSSVERSA